MQVIRYMAGVVACAASLAAPVAVSAQGMAPPSVDPAGTRRGILTKVGIDQKIGQPIPLDLVFTDESGQTVRLGQYFGKRPVILALVYYECPMLCTQVLNGLVSSLGTMNFTAGKEFDVVAVSFNPKEGPQLAAQKKAAYLDRYKRPESAPGWHFLTGSQESITALTEAVGFHYAYDEALGQYAHGAAIELLTPKGVLARYFYGIEFSARDIRLGVIEASDERVGTIADDVLLLCYHYDPESGKYGATVVGLIRLGGIATVLGAAIFITTSLRRERSSRPQPSTRT